MAFLNGWTSVCCFLFFKLDLHSLGTLMGFWKNECVCRRGRIGGWGIPLMDASASQTEEVYTIDEKDTNAHTNGHEWSTHAHQQGVVVGWSQGRVAGWRFLLPEHPEGVLLIAADLTRVRDGRDV